MEEFGTIEHMAHEGFIRRAAKLAMPFMLKGSYVTRQYFPEGVPRYPADLDWVFLGDVDDPVDAAERFDEWMIAVTELDLNDGIKFRSFSENRFWRMIDYAMADDFPTVNTDIVCRVDGVEVEFTLDLSFNLDVEQPPGPLLYQPFRYDPFEVPFTVPMSLQVSWKMHQTLVRPRFKDLFDLAYLVSHPAFNEATLDHTLQALVNECAADNLDAARLRYFLNYDFAKLFPANSIKPGWRKWRHGDIAYGSGLSSYWEPMASHITDAGMLPENLNDFLLWVAGRLASAGIGAGLIPKLPEPSRSARKGYRGPSNGYFDMNPDLKLYGLPDRPLADTSAGTQSADSQPGSNDAGAAPERSGKRGFFKMIKNWFS